MGYCFSEADIPGLKDSLATVDWSPVLQAASASNAATCWTELVQCHFQKFVPYRQKTSRLRSQPWYSSFLVQLARCRNCLFQRSHGKPASHSSAVAYRHVRNLYVRELGQAKRDYYGYLNNALSSRYFHDCPHKWRTMAKPACGWKASSTIPPLISGKTLVTAAADKAEVLNAHFAAQCS